MKIFLDTNIFYGDWFTASAAFRHLFHFINNSGHELLISRLVVQEIENKRKSELATAMSSARKAMTSIEKMTGSSLAKLPDESETPGYDFLANVNGAVDDVTVIEYDHIPQAIVVERALGCKRPFLQGEKGYRDTLIWLSLLEHLKSCADIVDLAFITANGNDFFQGDKAVDFHPDLKLDLATLPKNISIRPFRSLASFVDNEIDKDKHAIDIARAEELFEDYIEDESEAFLSSTKTAAFKQLQAFLTPNTLALANATEVSAEIYEGLEDFEITSTSLLNDEDVYVACKYNLRIVVVDFFIPKHDLDAYSAVIDGSQNVIEVDSSGSLALVKAVLRTYFAASFSYNRGTGDCTGFSVSSLHFR